MVNISLSRLDTTPWKCMRTLRMAEKNFHAPVVLTSKYKWLSLPACLKALMKDNSLPPPLQRIKPVTWLVYLYNVPNLICMSGKLTVFRDRTRIIRNCNIQLCRTINTFRVNFNRTSVGAFRDAARRLFQFVILLKMSHFYCACVNVISLTPEKKSMSSLNQIF